MLQNLNRRCNMKICKKCESRKDESDFGKNKSRKDGLSFYCKQCISILGKENTLKHREKLRKRSEEYRNNNPEKYKKYFKENYEKNKEKLKEKQREYYWKNREEICRKENEKTKTPEYREKAKQYREKNKDKIRDQRNAHRLIMYAIKLGVLKKSLYCEECGMTDCLIDGHHENYDEPLKVKWVCRKCHRKLEKIGN